MAADPWSRHITRRRALAGIGASGALLAQPAAGLAKEQTMPADAHLSHHLTAGALQAASGLRAGDWARTAGFHAPGDGGAALYRIGRAGEGPQPDGAAVLSLSDGLAAELAEGRAVTYRMFGAVGDGQGDDGAAIKAAHAWANAHRVPVVNRSGQFWVGATHGIEIRTPVDWGQTVFHIDERHNSRREPRFLVRNDRPTVEVPLDGSLKSVLLERIRPGAQIVPELAAYAGHLIVVIDDLDRIGIRAGNYGKHGWARQELFYVEEEGRILGDIAWAFRDVTSVRAIPCNDDVLVIQGGTFYFSGDSPQDSAPGYHYHGIQIERSRTVVRDQWMGLEPGRRDVSMEPRRGCYVLHGVYDVTLENIRCLPWEKNRPGKDRDVAHGTYGIGGARMLHCTFRNLTAEAGWVAWGVFGTNLNKDFLLENCRLNRVDVHFHCWNLTIRDCTIGFKGISVTGGGDLLVENTVRHGNVFINFRPDYGSRWDGRIRLRGCTLRPTDEGPVRVLAYGPRDFDYRYPIGYGRSIEVEDLVIDYAAVPQTTAPCWLLQAAGFSRTSDGRRLFFPRRLVWRHVRVAGRSQGVRLMRLVDASQLDLGAEGSLDRDWLSPNCSMVCHDVQLEAVVPARPDDVESAHLVIEGEPPGGGAEAAAGGTGLFLRLRFTDCDGLVVVLNRAVASLTVERCTVNLVRAPRLGGELVFSGCHLRPEVEEGGDAFYQVDGSLGTRFTNCTLHAPVVGGRVAPEQVDRLGILKVNGAVRYYHLNTGLGTAVLDHWRQAGRRLDPAFVARLRAHHPLEE